MSARDHTGRSVGHQSKTSRWHDVRAVGKRELFERVAQCPDNKRKVSGTCRAHCGHGFSVPVGCGSQMFCPECRADAAERTRIAFNRKRLGLLQLAKRSGNLAEPRMHKRGARWVRTHRVANPAAREVGGFSERFVTLTVPHVGGAGERIRTLRATWSRFWRTLADEIRPKLKRRKARIGVGDHENGFRARWDRKRGQHVAPDELSLWDLVAYLHVLEWTEGDDGLGHPHLHVWLFAPWISWQTIRAHWSSAYAHVMGIEDHTPLLVTDIRKASDDVGRELVKYLTKDWSDDDKRRVRPEVFAEVYAALDGARRRQTSAGLSHWQLGKHTACPLCGHERERGHWAFVVIERPAPPARTYAEPDLPPMPGLARVQPPTRAEDLRQAYDEARRTEWEHSVERRLLVERLREAGIVHLQTGPVVEPVQLQLGERK
jgi:rubredoxin